MTGSITQWWSMHEALGSFPSTPYSDTHRERNHFKLNDHKSGDPLCVFQVRSFSLKMKQGLFSIYFALKIRHFYMLDKAMHIHCRRCGKNK